MAFKILNDYYKWIEKNCKKVSLGAEVDPTDINPPGTRLIWVNLDWFEIDSITIRQLYQIQCRKRNYMLLFWLEDLFNIMIELDGSLNKLHTRSINLHSNLWRTFERSITDEKALWS